MKISKVSRRGLLVIEKKTFDDFFINHAFDFRGVTGYYSVEKVFRSAQDRPPSRTPISISGNSYSSPRECARTFILSISTPRCDASGASGLARSAVHFVVGGLPQTRPIAAQPTHFPSGPR